MICYFFVLINLYDLIPLEIYEHFHEYLSVYLYMDIG